MRKKGIKNKVTAFAAALLVAMNATAANGAAVQALQTAGDITVFSGTVKFPTDYQSAVAFRNQYGAFYIDTSAYAVYVVFEEPVDTNETPRFQVHTAGELKESSHEIYRMPEDETGGGRFQYEVIKYGLWPWRVGTVSLIDTQLPEEEQTVETYRFKSGAQGYIQSDDIYAWLPDSPAEFESFTKKSDILIHGNYIVFCLTDTAGTAYRWKESTSDNVNQENVQKVLSNSFVRRQIPEPTGGAIYSVIVYEAKKDGPVQINWEKRGFDPSEAPLDTRSGAFQIMNNAAQVLKPTDAWVELIDADTAKRVNFHSYPLWSFAVSTDVGISDEQTTETDGDGLSDTAPLFSLLNNPSILPDFTPFFQTENFSFGLSSPASYQVLPDETTVTHFENGAAAIQFKLKYLVQGDTNNDHLLTPMDAFLMQHALSGEYDLTADNCTVLDMNENGMLDAVDLTMMKRALLKEQETLPVCTMNVKTDYYCTNVYGDALGNGSFENTFTIRKGDIFYEDDRGNLMQNSMMLHTENETPVLKIVDVNDRNLQVLMLDSISNDEMKEITVPYDTVQKDLVFSLHSVLDAIGYSYEVTFSDYTQPQNDPQ